MYVCTLHIYATSEIRTMDWYSQSGWGFLTRPLQFYNNIILYLKGRKEVEQLEHRPVYKILHRGIFQKHTQII